jgi:hypothetical protein
LAKRLGKQMDYKEIIRDYGVSTYYSLLLPAIRGLEYNKLSDGYAYDETKAETVKATIAVIETLFDMVDSGSDTPTAPIP